jgi:hypothetical protein
MTRVIAEPGLDHYAVAMIDPEGNEFDINWSSNNELDPVLDVQRRLGSGRLLRPGCHGSAKWGSVKVDVDTLVEETEQVAYPPGVVQRCRVCPHEVFDQTVGDDRRQIRRSPVICTPRHVLAGPQLDLHVLGGQVVARGQHGLEQQVRAAGVSEYHTIEFESDVARARQYLDAVERVARMAVVALVLLEPLLGAFEVDNDVPREGVIVRAIAVECSSTNEYLDSLAGGSVNCERRSWVQNRAVAE